MSTTAIIITTHGSDKQEYCKICIDSIISLEFRKHIFVFDNESSDDWTCNIPKNYPTDIVHYIRINDQKSNGGLTGTWNQGIDKAIEYGCNSVILINNDTRVDQNFVDLVRAVSESKDLSVYGPLTNNPGHIKKQDVKNTKFRTTYTIKAISTPINGFCFGAPIDSFSKNKFDSKYYFDPKFPFAGNEDEWCKRLKRKGGTFNLVTSCYVHHDKLRSW